MQYLIIIDMQNDFVTGSLGSKEAQNIIQNAVHKIQTWDGQMIFTLDTHHEDYLQTQEGKMLPVPHCIKGTGGWRIIPEIEVLMHNEYKELKDNIHMFAKNTFGSVEMCQWLQSYVKKGDTITIIGLCTDICVVSNALMIKAFLPEIPITVDTTCCAGTTIEKHDAALKTMESCQIQIQ